MLVIFPAGGIGAALGPPLAARLGGAFAPWCDFLVSESDSAPIGRARLQLLRLRPDGRTRRRLDPLEIERPIVATVCAGRRPPSTGQRRDLEVEVVPTAPRPTRALAFEPTCAANPYAALQEAAVLVLVAPEVARGDGAALVDALRAGPGAGVEVVLIAEVPASVLATCCPDLIVKLGLFPTLTARSPRTRVIQAMLPGWPEAAPEDVDVVWQLGSPAELPELVRRIGGRG